MKRTILVVDDQPSVRRLLRQLFGLDGFAVEEAENGVEALEKIRDARPDLCVLDVMMPGLDGWEVLRSVRSGSATSELPVVMLTAKRQHKDRMKAWELGCDAYIPKPFEPKDCLETVHAVLVRTAEERAAMRERQMAVVRAMMVA